MSNYTAKPFMGKEDTYHFATVWPSGKSAGCPGGGGLGIFGWVCAARDSKLAPRSKKNFP